MGRRSRSRSRQHDMTRKRSELTSRARWAGRGRKEGRQPHGTRHTAGSTRTKTTRGASVPWAGGKGSGGGARDKRRDGRKTPSEKRTIKFWGQESKKGTIQNFNTEGTARRAYSKQRFWKISEGRRLISIRRDDPSYFFFPTSTVCVRHDKED